jgi:uncharacterized protein (TIGR03067 family)
MITATIFMILALVIAADDPPEDAVQKELKNLEGDWILVCIKDGAQICPYRPEDGKFITYRIKGTTVTCSNPVVLWREATEHAEWTLKINPLMKPKTFDLYEKPDAAVGIYEWEGEWLKVNYERLEKNRPKDFQWVAILAHDSKEEREAVEMLARAFDGQAVRQAQCEEIIEARPKTAAAAIALNALGGPAAVEERKAAAKQAAKLLDLAKKGPLDKAKERYLEILRRYPETPAAREAKVLFDKLATAGRKLKYAKMLAEDGIKMGKEELIEKARVHCRQIIETSPNTTFAKEAEELLDKLSK